MEEEGAPNLEEIEKQISEQSDENNYLRNKNLGLNDAVESNFVPRIEPNVIEFKLSPEELLERIEHYLRGDVLKSRRNKDDEVETFYTAPTKKITVTLFQNVKSKITYVVDEHSKEDSNNKNEDVWEILSTIEGEGEDMQETILEDNYKDFLLGELKKGLEGKKKKFVSQGFATKEVADNSRINLNEYGIAEFMNTLSMYINKETFLSFYKEDRINEIMADIGDKINEFLLINGKLMGLDTEYKKTKYPLMVVTVLHVIESAYRRALLGNENRGTREGILITQHQPQGGNQMPMQVPKKKWSAFDKSTW
jgi:hypothetical protein